MAFYRQAGWRFWIVLFIEYLLILLGMLCNNTFMVFGGMLLGVAIFPWIVYIVVKDNGINKIRGK